MQTTLTVAPVNRISGWTQKCPKWWLETTRNTARNTAYPGSQQCTWLIISKANKPPTPVSGTKQAVSRAVQTSDLMPALRSCHRNAGVAAPQPVPLCSAPITAAGNSSGLPHSEVAAASQGGRWGHTHGEWPGTQQQWPSQGLPAHSTDSTPLPPKEMKQIQIPVLASPHCQ